MRKGWFALVIGVFLLTSVGVGLLYGRRSKPATVNIGAAESEACVGCGLGDAGVRVGKGRIPGEELSLPDTFVGAPVVVVSVSEGCDYCAVPIATVALALSRTDSGTCDRTDAPSLVIVGTRQADLAATQWLTENFPSSMAHVEASLKSESWQSVLATDLVPSVLVIDESAVVVAQWIGFDPGHLGLL